MGIDPEDIAGFMSRIETKLDTAIGRLDDHETRIRLLEGKSGLRWETLVSDVIKLVVAAALGYCFAALK